MPAVASKDMQWEAVVEGLTSRYRRGAATKGGMSEEQGAVAVALVRDECDLLTRSPRGEGSGSRWVGVVFFSVVVRVLRWVECQRGFHGV